MSNKKTDKTRTHAPTVNDFTPNPNKADNNIFKNKDKDQSVTMSVRNQQVHELRHLIEH